MRDHQGTAGCGGGSGRGRGRHHIYGSSNKKGQKGLVGCPIPTHHWPPIEEFICSDPGRRDVLKQRDN